MPWPNMDKAEDRARERERMLSPLDWPVWPWLPIKRRGASGFLEVARIYADDTVEGQPVPVYFWPEDRAKPEDRVLKTYTDVDAVLDDGWVID